ncbi:hypothetical protein BY996DRAFT_6410177 [Phakopsora pachyrhizi]|nr:hypothetical protein BY996DRAFT_6410177 [Phakopsora pachyrhizi]
MQALNRDWERLLTKSSMNHREVVQGVDQVICHLKLLKDLLHCDGFQVMPNGLNPILMQALNRDPSCPTGPANPSPCPTCPSRNQEFTKSITVQDLKWAREQESAAQRLEQDAQQKTSEMQLDDCSNLKKKRKELKFEGKSASLGSMTLTLFKI